MRVIAFLIIIDFIISLFCYTHTCIYVRVCCKDVILQTYIYNVCNILILIMDKQKMLPHVPNFNKCYKKQLVNLLI